MRLFCSPYSWKAFSQDPGPGRVPGRDPPPDPDPEGAPLRGRSPPLSGAPPSVTFNVLSKEHYYDVLFSSLIIDNSCLCCIRPLVQFCQVLRRILPVLCPVWATATLPYWPRRQPHLPQEIVPLLRCRDISAFSVGRCAETTLLLMRVSRPGYILFLLPLDKSHITCYTVRSP